MFDVMTAPENKDVTGLLAAWKGGEQGALDQLVPLVYDELRRLARRYLRRERPDHTLQTTALVHEAYLRLVGSKPSDWENRVHFFAAAAQVMRHILVDHARSRQAAKRAGGYARVTLDEGAVAGGDQGVDLLAVDEALTALAALDPQQARVVELRVFGGLSVEEAAEAMGVSPRTVKREWSMAKAWLHRQIQSG